MVSWLAIFGGPTGPVPAFGEPCEPVVGCAGLFDVNPRFGSSATRAGRFTCACRFVEVFGACTVIAGNVVESVVPPTTTGRAPADSVAVTVCANDRCSNVSRSTAVDASARNLFDRSVKGETQNL
jgi:hypothetical protein